MRDEGFSCVDLHLTITSSGGEERKQRKQEAERGVCYDAGMTTVEILYRYSVEPGEQAALALARTRDVYGIRGLKLDRAAQTVRVEFDATRLTAAEVTRLLMGAGLQIAEEAPQIAAPEAAAPAA